MSSMSSLGRNCGVCSQRAVGIVKRRSGPSVPLARRCLSTSTSSTTSSSSVVRLPPPQPSSPRLTTRRETRGSCPRHFSTCGPSQERSRDPGGKPNDGSHPTVYDDFKNITASDEEQISIHSMGDSSFTMSDGLIIHTPLILLNKQAFLWDAPDLKSTPEKPIMPNGIGWEQWTDDAWRLFEVVSPRPEIIIFGTGRTVLPLPPKVKAYLNTLGVQIEAHDTRNACSTYNMLAEEDRLVAAALIPPERKPTKKLKANSVVTE